MERLSQMDLRTTDIVGMVGSNVMALLFICALLFVSLYMWIPGSRSQDEFPVWATIEVALISLCAGNGSFAMKILSVIRKNGGSFYGITSKHQVLVNLPTGDRLLSQPFHTLNPEPIRYTLYIRVFGGTDSPNLKAKMDASWRELSRPIEELFLNDSAATAAIKRANVPRKAAVFVSSEMNNKEMKRWELAARTKIVRDGKLPGQVAVEADLQSLARDFGACITIPALYGQDFLDRNPGLLDDFWRFDNDLFPLLMIGTPEWIPMRIMREGLAARARLLEALEALYRRIDQYQKGEPVDFGVDMSDVGITALGRNQGYVSTDWSFPERAVGDLAMLWASNANTQPLFLWFLGFVYSTPGLICRLREEIAPYIEPSSGTKYGIESMNYSSLFNKCPLVKACILETFRMADDPTSIRYVKRPVTVNNGTSNQELKPGTFLSVPHSVIQRDPSIFVNPDQFDPDRFLGTDAKSGKTTAQYGRLRPWGSGAGMCKGRTFAEREIVALGAAVMWMWDIEPASGTWNLPAMIPGTGAKKPVKDLRVLITQRG